MTPGFNPTVVCSLVFTSPASAIIVKKKISFSHWFSFFCFSAALSHRGRAKDIYQDETFPSIEKKSLVLPFSPEKIHA